MRVDNSRHLIAAAHDRTRQTRIRAQRALRRLDTVGAAITFGSVASEAGVSRSWLYTQSDIRAEIERLRARQRPSTPKPPIRQRASDASLLRRLEVAAGRLRQLEEDNRQLREALARALGDARTARVLGNTPVDPTRPDGNKK